MAEIDLTEYKKRMDEVNEYLKDHGIEPISNPDYFKPNNTRLISEMCGWSNAGNYVAAANTLSIIGRKDDENRLAEMVNG